MVSACRIPPFLSFKPFQAGINLAHDKKHVIERSWPEAGVSPALAVILIESSPALVRFMSEPASHPITTVQILPITFEPSTGLRRQIVGEPFPRRLSRKVGWQKRASCTDKAE